MVNPADRWYSLTAFSLKVATAHLLGITDSPVDENRQQTVQAHHRRRAPGLPPI